MIASSKSRRAVFGAIVGLLYGFALTLLSIFAAGAGHGTAIPLWLSSAPLGVFGLVPWRVGALSVDEFAMLFSPPVVWAALGSLAALPKRSGLTRILLLLQYAYRAHARCNDGLCTFRSGERCVGGGLCRGVGGRLRRGSGGVVAANNEANLAGLHLGHRRAFRSGFSETIRPQRASRWPLLAQLPTSTSTHADIYYGSDLSYWAG